jgi:hypothetical protein
VSETEISRFEFQYTIIEDGALTGFAVERISQDVAHGIRVGLESVSSITDVTAVQVIENREEVPIP